MTNICMLHFILVFFYPDCFLSDSLFFKMLIFFHILIYFFNSFLSTTSKDIFLLPSLKHLTLNTPNHLRKHYTQWSNIITIIIPNKEFKWAVIVIWFSFRNKYFINIYTMYIKWFFVFIEINFIDLFIIRNYVTWKYLVI